MKLGIVGNTKKAMLWETIPQLLSCLNDYSIQAILHKDIIEKEEISGDFVSASISEIIDQVDIIASFGGDGTILSTAYLIKDADIPILGINLDGLGFLAEVGLDEICNRIEDVVCERYEIEERMVLEASSSRYQEQLFALNDIVIDKGDLCRAIRLETFIGEDYLNTYIADGLIVATPTGSTAYSLAANGPIVFPTMGAMIISPICSHALGARSLVIAENETIRITVDGDRDRLTFTADGQMIQNLKPGDTVEIKKADHTIKLIKFPDRDYYSILRTKLNWGQRSTQEKEISESLKSKLKTGNF